MLVAVLHGGTPWVPEAASRGQALPCPGRFRPVFSLTCVPGAILVWEKFATAALREPLCGGGERPMKTYCVPQGDLRP